MECTVRSSGVCSTSFRPSLPLVSGRGKSSLDCTAAGGGDLQWKWGSRSNSASLSSSSRELKSGQQAIVPNRKNGFWKLQKSLRTPQNIRMSATQTTTDEPTEEESITETMPEQGVLSQHPLDPHKPNWSDLIPEAVRPYPSFEGWFVRIWDTESNFSAAIIMATNYVTEESQVTLLFAPSEKDVGTRNPNSVRSEEDGKYVLRTYAVAELSKNATFVDIPSNNVSEDHKPLSAEPVGFEWQSPGLGKIKCTAEMTEIDVTIKGYSLQTRLTNNLLWDADQSQRGPEGWARSLPVPTHWYVYSLGSTAEYKFSGPDGDLARSGKAWAHQEKNWGLAFPSGHVWFQAFSEDNSAQFIGSGACYKLGEKVKSPYLFTVGYRSPTVNIDMRTNDLGTVFKNFSISPLTGEFSVEGVSASHSIFIRVKADPQSLSEAVLAPMAKVHWHSACRETFLADLDVEVYEHAVWGATGKSKLVEKRTFKYAGLEFGEDLLKEASEKAAQVK